ncbi:hypothetical protein FBZ85_12314 [Azospirillum brasilense]|nr:hypothetical protein FBZ85_12314 [Azospirillum brasilense]
MDQYPIGTDTAPANTPRLNGHEPAALLLIKPADKSVDQNLYQSEQDQRLKSVETGF